MTDEPAPSDGEDVDPAPPAVLDDEATLRERVASGRLFAMSDFDGTLAEIVEQPEDAVPRSDARAALERLAAAPRTSVAVVSGRALADLRGRVALDGVAYAGNHGLEIEAGEEEHVHPDAAEARTALDAALDDVASATAGVEGVRIEDKELTATVHYRSVDDPDDVSAVREAVQDAAGRRASLELSRAKAALEVRPAVDWDKGSAVTWLLETVTAGEATPLYVGDDATDEDAFRAIGDDGVTVRVGDGETAAAWRVPDPAAVAALLAWIADLRHEADGAE